MNRRIELDCAIELNRQIGLSRRRRPSDVDNGKNNNRIATCVRVDVIRRTLENQASARRKQLYTYVYIFHILYYICFVLVFQQP